MSGQGGCSEPLVPDFDPYERELREILADLESGAARKTAGIETAFDSASVSFKCRALARAEKQ